MSSRIWLKGATTATQLTCVLFAVFVLGSCRSSAWPVSTNHGKVVELAAGELLYRDGLSTNNTLVRAISENDVPLTGAQAACVTCHRPSGLGSAEGGYYVPPINGPLLFAPRKLDRLRLFQDFVYQVQPAQFRNRLYQPRMRPAYTTRTLGIALRTGVDPAGHPLEPIMPRYQLTDADVEALSTYLHSLSARIDPGVDGRVIHFATVFSNGVPPAQRAAMLETMRAYVRWHNLHLHDDRSRGRFSPYIRSPFVPIERRWVLSVWELGGDDSTWRAQLEKQYEEQPVFALVGGKVNGSWSGPARFCDANKLPCLFPDTELPGRTGKYGYTTYFSAGLKLEAFVAARFLAKYARVHPHSTIDQFATEDDFGQVPMRIFDHELTSLLPGWKQNTRTFHDPAQLTALLDARNSDKGRILVVWPGADVEATVRTLAAANPRAKLILLPSRTIEATRHAAPGGLAARMRFVDPYALQIGSHAKSFETRAWLNARHLKTDHIRTRFKAYYTMNLLDTALSDIRNDFYRDYLMERIEDESLKDLNPGMYPWLALGPGERYAAKVAQIVRFDASKPSGLVSVGGWIAP